MDCPFEPIIPVVGASPPALLPDLPGKKIFMKLASEYKNPLKLNVEKLANQNIEKGMS